MTAGCGTSHKINKNTKIQTIQHKVLEVFHIMYSCTLTILCIKCANSSKSLSCDYEGQAYRGVNFLNSTRAVPWFRVCHNHVNKEPVVFTFS